MPAPIAPSIPSGMLSLARPRGAAIDRFPRPAPAGARQTQVNSSGAWNLARRVEHVRGKGRADAAKVTR
jgi:hypothetical protein